MQKYDPRGTELVVMVGFPRSGKSTAAKILSQQFNAPVVEPDAIRDTILGTPYNEDSEPLIHAISGVMVKSLFRAGHKMVILDETGIRRKHRDLARGMAERVYFYHIPTSPEVCKQRAIATGQEYLLPVIDRMAEKFEPLEEDEKRW